MKERPILFKGEMVRAILDGRKTQTRRTKGLEVIKEYENSLQFLRMGSDDPADVFDGAGGDDYAYFRQIYNGGRARVKCPYGQAGDRLWVRETWQPHLEAGLSGPGFKVPSDAICYAADYTEAESSEMKPWRPSIHMPRWASRITLEITDVRVERVADIGNTDILAEGLKTQPCKRCDESGVSEGQPCEDCDGEGRHFLYSQFGQLWRDINGIESWRRNDWVWVVEFKRVQS